MKLKDRAKLLSFNLQEWLENAPCEEKCTEIENEMYANMQNLLESVCDFIDFLEEKEKQFLITDTNEIVSEEYLRKLLYGYEIQDLLNNENEYFKGFLDLQAQMNCIEKAIKGNLEEVIDMLETNWNVPIEKINKE